MNNPRDKLQIEVLARQMFPNNSKYLIEAYEDAVRSSEYGYYMSTWMRCLVKLYKNSF